MPESVQIRVTPSEAFDNQLLKEKAEQHFPGMKVKSVEVVKRSIDARKNPVLYNLGLKVYLSGEIPVVEKFEFPGKNVSHAREIGIVGAGPAGLFAALTLITQGFKPVLFERGKDVKSRRRDLAQITKAHQVNPESNYCFGEGGAGTYSDGKLYTRSDKRGNTRLALGWLVAHGADTDILVNARPHIGTNKLPGLIENIRKTILDCGGEIYFNTQVIGILQKGKKLTGLSFADGTHRNFPAVILATGHSARDIFSMLHRAGAEVLFKPFAVGLRVEHPQELIDAIQYHSRKRDPYLPPANYSLAAQIKDCGVYSFCMCPGGIIAPCATAPDQIVTNGWSPSKRNNPFANSGIVAEVTWQDMKPFHKFGPLAGMYFQQSIENACHLAGGGNQTAPAQRLTDFLSGKASSSLPDCSYLPGITSVNLKEVLPPRITEALRSGLKLFGKKMKGFETQAAVLVAPETRTSSPVRIPRDPETLQHPGLSGLYPVGEGAGYAGGILSAAMDGMRSATQAANSLV